MAIIKQLQFHMACSFQIEEKRGGGGESIVVKKRVKFADIDVPFSKSSLVQLGMNSTRLTKLHIFTPLTSKWISYSADVDDFLKLFLLRNQKFC